MAELRLGPWGRDGATAAATVEPPYGKGSLGIAVAGPPAGGSSTDAEKVAFGNESDFAGLRVADLEQIGFSVFATAPNSLNPADVSMPNITLEINPDLGGANYASMTYVPPKPKMTNIWQTFDATSEGEWFLTGNAGAITGCSAASRCSYDELREALGPNAEVTFSVGVGKGRDKEFVGAIDGLQINDKIYDFEPYGVYERDVS